ncbi:MAG: ABC transporter permease [Solirubrobacterales bacterium]
MLRVELLKIRRLPTPRWVFIVTILAVAVASAVVIGLKPTGQDVNWYIDGPKLAGEIMGPVGAIILGAWVAGLDFASRTIRLSATVQPLRGRLLAAKLAAAVIIVVVFSAFAFGLAFGAAKGCTLYGDVPFPVEQQLRDLGGQALQAALWGLLGFCFALLLRSYIAGLVITLVLAIGVDSLLQLIPTVGRYTFGSATTSLADSIAQGSAEFAAPEAAGIAAAWLVVLFVLGAIRFRRGDLA